jgi:hypothetical protein
MKEDEFNSISLAPSFKGASSRYPVVLRTAVSAAAIETACCSRDFRLRQKRKFEFGQVASYWHPSGTSTVLKNGLLTQCPSVLGVQHY